MEQQRLNESNPLPQPNSILQGCCSFLCVVVIPVGLLIWACVDFQDSWSEDCSYDEKIWVVVMLSTPIAHLLFVVIRKQILLFLLGLFQLCWWLYGIKPVLVDDNCNEKVHQWGLAIWWLPVAIAAAMCLLVCCAACCLMGAAAYEQQHPSGTPAQPTPPEVISFLETKAFRDIKPFLPTEDLPMAPAPAPEAREGRATGYMRSISTQAGVGMPAFLNSRAPPPAARAAPIGRPGNGPRCTICWCDFEDEDMLTVLPCDPRHVFHKPCITSWLSKSQDCPICRANIAALVQV